MEEGDVKQLSKSEMMTLYRAGLTTCNATRVQTARRTSFEEFW